MRLPYSSDDQFLRIDKGFHSSQVLLDKLKMSLVPVQSTLVWSESALVSEWMRKWSELANGPDIKGTDILGRLRFIRTLLETETWPDPVSAIATLVEMVDKVIEEVEKISAGF